MQSFFILSASTDGSSTPPSPELQLLKWNQPLIHRYRYLLTALLNHRVHYHLDQRGVAFLGPSSKILGNISLSLHTPFPALAPLLVLVGLSAGTSDCGNAWVGNMENAHGLLGFLHRRFGLRATNGSLIATAFVTEAHLPWWTFYYLILGLLVLELNFTLTSFWKVTGSAYRARHTSLAENATSTMGIVERQTCWLTAVLLLMYVGAEVSLGEILGVCVYLLLCIVFQLFYWTIPSFVASSVSIALEGYFLGAFSPVAIITLNKLLSSEHHHISAIGFAAAFGSGGTAIFPFAVGAIAQSRGGLKPGGLQRARGRNERPGHRLFAIVKKLQR
ncbi:major facilitator superfamily domain-containing protein [Xylariaceae sp. FL1272]|nr:major facilitator superfamily domain-containing protein [Xylariaceae sp. FL1272]